MDKLIRKTFNSEVLEKEENIVTVYVSTGAIDRDKEVILPSAWRLENYIKHPVLISSHDYGKLANQIGIATDVLKDSKGIKFKFKYFTGKGNFEADWGYFLATQGVASYSVGFPFYSKFTDDPEEMKGLLLPLGYSLEEISTVKRVWTEVELLENSQVLIPSNPEAIQSDSYYGFIKSFITKPEPETSGEYIIIRVEDPDKFVEDSFRTIIISSEKGIKATVGKYKSDPDGPTHVQRYLFDKDKWTLAEAEVWVREHKSSDDIIKEYENLEFEQKLINSSLEEKVIQILKAIVDKNKF